MKRSWLVQRLKAPRSGGFLGVDNPFAFGGGLKNGGLSDEAMGLLREIFSFDYMGAAEFEFGAVPEALHAIANNAARYASFALPIPLVDVPADWRDKDPAPGGDGVIYVLCRADDAAEVQERIRSWATSHRNDLKEPTRLATVLRPFHEWDSGVRGWLELDNGFFFFIDRAMWAATARLFGIEGATAEESHEVVTP